MVDSSLTNVDNCENLIATPPTHEGMWTKSSSKNPPVSKLSYSATPQAEPRRIPSSPYRNTQVSHEIKCESDHTFPKQRHPAGLNLPTCTNIQNGQRNPSTQEFSAY